MSILGQNALLNNVKKNCKIGREGHPLVESGLTNLDEKCIGKQMFHTAVFSKTLQNGVFMTEWMTWDLKDSLVIESHKCCYLQHCQKKQSHTLPTIPIFKKLLSYQEELLISAKFC